MKLLIIRHGDPDYKNDTLTEKGWREAEYVAEMLSDRDITEFYTGFDHLFGFFIGVFNEAVDLFLSFIRFFLVEECPGHIRAVSLI